MRTLVGGNDQVFLRNRGRRDRNERASGLRGRGSFSFHSHHANAGAWERGAAGHIELGVTNKLLRQVGETGFRHVSLELIDHDRRGAEQFVMDRTGRTGFVARDVAVPAFELKGDRSGIPIFQVDEGREEKHGSSDDDPFERREPGMGLDGFVDGNARRDDLVSERVGLFSQRHQC